MKTLAGDQTAASQAGPNLVRTLSALGPWRALIALTLVVLAAYWLALAFVFGIIPTGPDLTNRLGGTAAGDFMYFYPAARLAAEGRAADMYDWPLLTAVARATLGPKTPELDWAYPPTVWVLLAPLGRLAPLHALVLWVGTALCLTLLLGRLLLGRWQLAPLALLFPGAALAMFCGHQSALLAGLVVTVALCGPRNPLLAGLALGFLSIKPHIAVAATLVLGIRRHYRVVLYGVITGMALAALSVVFVGFTPWFAFPAALQATSRSVATQYFPTHRFVTVFATVLTLGGGTTLALLFHTLGAVSGLLLCARLLSAPLTSLRTLGFGAGTLLVTPYALDYDLVLLLPAWLLLIAECRERPELSRSLLPLWASLVVLVPLGYMIQLYTGKSVSSALQIGVLGLALASSRQVGGRQRGDDSHP